MKDSIKREQNEHVCSAERENLRTQCKIKIQTMLGDIVVRLYDETPIHRDNFVKLAKERLALLCILFLPLAAWAQKQYYLPTAGASDEEKDKPMIEVYLPKETNGCAVVLCPGGAMRGLSWESDVVKMASFLNEHGIAAIGLRYHLNKASMPQGMKMPPMVDVTHPEAFYIYYFLLFVFLKMQYAVVSNCPNVFVFIYLFQFIN